jgi:long-chain acyl-CoA synthetase
MTEISSVCHVVPPEMKNTMAGSCGLPVPGTSCKIVDPESGLTVGPNETGEIRIQGPQVKQFKTIFY